MLDRAPRNDVVLVQRGYMARRGQNRHEPFKANLTVRIDRHEGTDRQQYFALDEPLPVRFLHADETTATALGDVIRRPPVAADVREIGQTYTVCIDAEMPFFRQCAGLPVQYAGQDGVRDLDRRSLNEHVFLDTWLARDVRTGNDVMRGGRRAQRAAFLYGK